MKKIFHIVVACLLFPVTGKSTDLDNAATELKLEANKVESNYSRDQKEIVEDLRKKGKGNEQESIDPCAINDLLCK